MPRSHGDNLLNSEDCLLSCLKCHSVVKIPEELDLSDIDFSSSEFRRRFYFGSNVHVDIVFQKYNEKWEEYIS